MRTLTLATNPHQSVNSGFTVSVNVGRICVTSCYVLRKLLGVQWTKTVIEPSLSGHKAAIAQAAADAGFDVSNKRALSDLITAVDHAGQLASATDRRIAIYPDHWRGTGRYKSDMYPDRWVPGLRSQTLAIRGARVRTITRSPEPARKALVPTSTQAHAARPSVRLASPVEDEIIRSLPALTLRTDQQSFDLPLRALLRAREDVDDSSIQDVTIITKPVKTGSNQQPLGSRKRRLSDESRGFVPFKVPKNADVALADNSVVHDGVLISGHGSDEQTTDTEYRSALGNVTNSDHIRRKRSTLPKGRVDPPYLPSAPRNRTSRKATLTEPHHRTFRPVFSEAKGTTKAMAEGKLTKQAFEKVRNKLQNSLDNIQKDRNTLSKRWEADDQLKDPAAMDELTQLNEHLGTVEEGLGQVIQITDRIIMLT